MTKFTLNLTQIFEEDRKKNKLLKQKIKKLLSYDDIMMELQLDYDGITDETTMAQASTLVPVTKMKKAQAWTLALSWGSTLVPVTKMKKAQAWTLALSWGSA